ncbi:MAG: hypothetical protein ACRDRR_03040 [Pseudonocardiaceae bacterium]
MRIEAPCAIVTGRVARPLAMLLRAASRKGAFDGMPPGPRREVLDALADLEAAGLAWLEADANRAQAADQPGRDRSARPQIVTSSDSASSACQVMTIAEAARLLRLTQARVRQLAPMLGHKRGHRWVLDRSAVLAEFERRSAAVA